MQNNAGASYVYVCVHVITVVTEELVHPSPILKITSGHSLKKEGVVRGPEYCPEKTAQTILHP